MINVRVRADFYFVHSRESSWNGASMSRLSFGAELVEAAGPQLDPATQQSSSLRRRCLTTFLPVAVGPPVWRHNAGLQDVAAAL